MKTEPKLQMARLGIDTNKRNVTITRTSKPTRKSL